MGVLGVKRGMGWGVGGVFGGGGRGWGRRCGQWGLRVGRTKILGICLISWLIHMVKISSKSEVFQFSGGRTPYLGAYNNRKKLIFWDSALFSG